MIVARSIEHGREWDDLLLALDPAAEAAPPHPLQSWAWGELKSRWGWTVERLVFESGGRPIAAAQAMSRRIGRTPVRVGYLPKGPYVPSLETAHWSPVLDAIERWAAARRLAFVKMDADVPAGALELLETWRDRGWRPSEDQIQFKNTLRSDLRADEDAMLAAMHSKTRYNIRLAVRRGVSVRAAGQAGIETALELYRATSSRQGFAIRALDYYRDAWATWIASGLGDVLIAEVDGEPLAMAVPVRFGDTAWYLYGASSDQMREAMAPHAVMWAALLWAKRSGCTAFDWWGGPDALEPSDPLWGVYRFKLGFGARFDEQAGAWDRPSNRITFAMYRGAVKARASMHRTGR